jgi:hypothetical protein
MKRTAIQVCVATMIGASALAFSATTASATSGAHFFRDTGASVNGAGALVVFIDEAGVGQANVDYLLTADASADYGCINGGGKHPQASNKESFVAEVSGSASFSPINGRVKATITAGPIGPGTFSCPPGQTMVLAAVSYDNITIADTTNNVSADPDGVAATFVTF